MDRRVVVTAEAARIGRQKTVRGFQTPLFQQGHNRDSISSRPMWYLSLSAAGHTSKTSTSKASVMEVNSRGCIVIDDRFNKSMPNFIFIRLVRCSHTEGIAAVECGLGLRGSRNNSNCTHPEVAWVGNTEQQLKEGVRYKDCRFPFCEFVVQDESQS